MSEPNKPFIPATTILPEITVKAVVLGFILSALLAAANAYMGLLLGMTVSASIPAAVISMGVLRFFKNSNILENNIVQTSASAGESLAAGAIFTLPALVLMGYWKEFSYFETLLITLSGGILGVLFTIPLRHALIVKEQLKFPEGVATAEVLIAGNKGGSLLEYLVYGSVFGALIKFVVEGLKLWGNSFEVAGVVKGKAYLYFGTYLTPAVMAVGYIVGLNISFLVFLGGAITWYLAIPAYAAYHGIPDGVDAAAYGGDLWSLKMRYLGVGAMIVGGIWAVISVRSSLVSAVKEGFRSFRKGATNGAEILRTEFDTPMSWVLIGIGVLIVPIFIIYLAEIEHVTISALMTVIMILAGFVFSAVAGYMAGLVGSSNNPISGVTIATVLTSALILAVLMGTDSGNGAASAILIGAVVCCAAAIAGDNMQDLKAGHVLGATPRNQQIMQMVGVVAGALVMAPVLNLLNNAWGIGSDNISAPQATLMRSVAEGVFGGQLPWAVIGIGAFIGILIILADQLLAYRGSKFRMPVLAVAVGLYLPFYLDSAILLGGLIAWGADRFYKKRNVEATKKKQLQNAGLLFASGLITGEALMGILLAIPIAYTENTDALRFFDMTLPDGFGFFILIASCIWLYGIATHAKANPMLDGEENE